MNILITRDMPLLDLYQGDTFPLEVSISRHTPPLDDNVYISTWQGKQVIFPPTCAEIDYSEAIQELQDYLDYLDFAEIYPQLKKETEDDIKNLEI